MPEPELHEAVKQLFNENAVFYKHEVVLSKQDRVDFMIDGIALEIKDGGGVSAIIRQLHRYAQCDAVASVILLTTKLSHKKVPSIMNGKSVAVIILENWV